MWLLCSEDASGMFRGLALESEEYALLRNELLLLELA